MSPSKGHRGDSRLTVCAPQDQPLLRLPYELLRKNFRTAHYVSEKESSAIKALLRETATASVAGRAAPADVLRNLDAMLAKMRGVKRKLAACADEEARLARQAAARIQHLADLQAMQAVDDGRYDAWSRRRLDRLLVDYLLRHGYNATATDLAREKNLEDLVDVKTFLQMSRIQESLRRGSVQEALVWCQDNKKELRKDQVGHLSCCHHVGRALGHEQIRPGACTLP